MSRFLLSLVSAGVLAALPASAEDYLSDYKDYTIKNLPENVETGYLYFKFVSDNGKQAIKLSDSNDYDISIKYQTKYGDSGESHYYKWSTNGDGNVVLDNGSMSDYDIVINGTVIQRNTGNDDTITGNFVALSGVQSGGAVSIQGDNSRVDSINGTFIGNSVNTISSNGGAIYVGNNASVGTIKGDFVGNYVSSTGQAVGGAIDNEYSKIDSIEGTFIGNYTYTTAQSSSRAYGGAIANRTDYTADLAVINSIKGHFVGNHSAFEGGAIFNDRATIGSIEGDFIRNYVDSTIVGDPHGGAIANKSNSPIDSIKGAFIGNSIYYGLASKTSTGGAIYSSGIIENILKGSYFKDNYIYTTSNAYGGAIANNYWADSTAHISSIESDFDGNYIYATGDGKGGAIYNIITIGSADQTGIIGNFSQNSVTSVNGVAQGGAIYNGLSTESDKKAPNFDGITGIQGNFAENYVSSTNGTAQGGAIYNTGTIGNINANKGFSDNYAFSAKDDAQGGAIYMTSGSIGTITGDFVKNSAKTEGTGTSSGGAIHLAGGTIDAIAGSFNNNTAESSTKTNGGAVYNYNGSSIKSITGDFDGNTAKSSSATATEAQGGAIYNNDATIETVSGNFTNNGAYTENGTAQGGAVYNTGTASLSALTGTFTGNYATSANGEGKGGAIYNTGTIDTISSSFTNNHASTAGGAIWSSENIKLLADGNEDYADITFSGNYIGDEDNKDYQAIWMDGKTLTIEADNEGTITFDDKISGQNYNIILGGSANSVITFNNLIENTSVEMDDITLKLGVTDSGNNISDVFKTTDATVNSGFVTVVDDAYTQYNIKNLTTTGCVGEECKDFDTQGKKYALYSIDIGVEDDVTYNDSFNITDNSSGIITLDNIVVDAFRTIRDGNNDDDDDNGIENEKEYIFKVIKGQNTENLKLAFSDKVRVVKEAAAVMDSGMELAKEFEVYKDDSIRVVGWRDSLAAWAELDDANDDGEKIFTLYENHTQKLTRDINEKGLMGDKLTIEGEGNSTLNLGKTNFLEEIKDGQTLTLDNLILKYQNTIGNKGTLNMSDIKFADAVDLNNTGEVNLTSGIFSQTASIDNKGTANLKNISMKSTDILNDGTVNVFDTASFGEGTIANNNQINLSSATVNINAEVNGNGKISVDDSTLYLLNGVNEQEITQTGEDSLTVVEKLEKFKDNTLNVTDGTVILHNVTGTDWSEFSGNTLNVSGGEVNITNGIGLNKINLKSLTLDDGAINLPSADADLENKRMGGINADMMAKAVSDNNGVIYLNDIFVLSDGENMITPAQFTNTDANTILGIDSASGPVYDYKVSFDNSGEYGDGGYVLFERDGFNEVVNNGSDAQLAGGYANMLQVYEYSFEHVDRFSGLPKNAELSSLCHSVVCAAYTGELPAAYKAMGSRAVWVKPYASFEHIDLKNGPKVNTRLYGTLVGADSNLISLGNGWLTALTGYLGYTGAVQTYDGNRTNQHGAVVGVTESFYNGNFYTALTASGGYSSGNTSTKFGPEHFRMKMGGIASKTGYNFAFNDGKFIIQPNLKMSYTALKADDYTSASTARIKSKTTDIVMLNPYIKLIYNMEDGYQPYTFAGVVFNNGKTDVTANDIQLPGLSFKPYAEYGLGVQRNWADDELTGYIEAIFRSGGRSGAAFTAGLRWNF